MAKYTHHKILNQSIYEAIGYTYGLVSHGLFNLEQASKVAALYYNLTVVERYVFDGMLGSAIAEKPVSVISTDYEAVIKSDPVKPAKASYTAADIKAQAVRDAEEYQVKIDVDRNKQLAEYQANQAKLQPQIDASNRKFAEELAAKGQQMDADGKISPIEAKIAANNACLDELVGANFPYHLHAMTPPVAKHSGTLNSVVLASAEDETELTPQKAAAKERIAAKKSAK